MKTAYFDCIGGISGDMALGALLHAGVDPEVLTRGLRTMELPPWELQIGKTQKSGISATTVEVVVQGEAAGAAPLMRLPPSDAPAVATHGHSHEHTHGGHEHAHSQGGQAHTHDHAPNGDGHEGTRTLADVLGVIRGSRLPPAVKQRSEKVFRRLAEAEAAVHGASVDEVHFHEVGAVDSIVDVVGTVYGLHLLEVDRVICSPLPTGTGFVRCAHGLMPVPPPATLQLMEGCPLRQVDVEGELVTPTGAALASSLAERFGPLPGFTVRGSGYGAGKKDFPFPNLLRVVLGEEPSAVEAESVVVIEANIDDQSPQLYESVMGALLNAGALDVWLTSIQMKKNRPAEMLSVLCTAQDLETITRIIFAETTTLGVRYSDWRRACLQREWIEVPTPYGTVRLKVGRHEGIPRTVMPEYDDCRRLAEESGVPLKSVHAAAAAAAWEILSGTG
jgi:pyridinium-3,5-bisthiocarboxylic acid mononucleotide nickel chelatase